MKREQVHIVIQGTQKKRQAANFRYLIVIQLRYGWCHYQWNNRPRNVATYQPESSISESCGVQQSGSGSKNAINLLHGEICFFNNNL